MEMGPFRIQGALRVLLFWSERQLHVTSQHETRTGCLSVALCSISFF